MTKELIQVNAKDTFVPSAYQARIFQDIVERELHSIVVSAVPGAGKTETIRRMIAYIGATYSVLTLAFNTDAANQLAEKVGGMLEEMAQAGMETPNVTSLTIHKLGNAALKTRSMSKKIENFKYNKLIKNFLQSKNIYDKNFTDSVKKLVDMTRLTLSGASVEMFQGEVSNISIDPQEMLQTVIRYDIDLDPEGEIEDGSYNLIPEWDLALETVSIVLQAGIKQARTEGIIDFTDMIWLPVILQISPTKYDYVLVDEAQDLSPCQRALVLSALKKNGYFVAVGDRNQAIYGFAGASMNSLDEIVEATGAIERKLSICYRCPRSVIDEADSIYSGIEAAPNAPEGITQYITSDKIFSILDQIEEKIAGTDEKKPLILSRVTAPLVSLCLELLRDGKRANVRGKDLGATFLSLIEKVKKFNKNFTERRFLELPDFMLDYKRRQIEMLESTGAEENESKIDSLNDKIDTLLVLFSAYVGFFSDPSNAGNIRDFIADKEVASFDGFLATVKSFFTDKPDAQIILSTGHRSKGLEYPYVIILGYDQIPHPKAKTPEQKRQERNLKYVMTTRAKKELYLVVGFVPELTIDSTAVIIEEEEKQEEVLVIPAPVSAPVLEVAEPKKRGRKATGRLRERKQYSLDPELVALIKRSAKASGKDESNLLEQIIKASPMYAALLEEDEGPELPPDGPDNGGNPSQDTANDELIMWTSGEEYAQDLQRAGLSFDTNAVTYDIAKESHSETIMDDEQMNALTKSILKLAEWDEEVETPQNSVEKPIAGNGWREVETPYVALVRRVYTCLRKLPKRCGHAWVCDYYRAGNGELFRIDPATGRKIEAAEDWHACAECDNAKEWIRRDDLTAKYNPNKKCTPSCRSAKRAECECSCAGANHGGNKLISLPLLGGPMNAHWSQDGDGQVGTVKVLVRC